MSDGCLVRVESLLASLNEAEKKVAYFVLKNAKKVIDMTISEVASASQVSETTVFRFCRAIDYKGFQDFRISLAQDLVDSTTKNQLDKIKDTDDTRTIAHKVFGNTIENLHSTLKLLNYKELEEAYTLIKNARRILVIGVSTSAHIARFAADKLEHFGLWAEAVTDVHYQAMRASQLTKDDVLLAFSRSGNSRDVIEALLIAKEKNAKIIGVTCNKRSYFAKSVDISLIVRSKDTRFRDDILASRIEYIAVVDVLYTLLAVRDPEKAEKNHSLIWNAALGKQY